MDFQSGEISVRVTYSWNRSMLARIRVLSNVRNNETVWNTDGGKAVVS